MPESKKIEDRYLVRVSLISARKSRVHKGEKKQYYFETGKKSRQRTPTRGYFEFNFEETSDMKEPITLFTELISLEAAHEVEVLLEFKEKNKSKMKVDEIVSKLKLSLKVGDKRQVYTINDDNLELKVAMTISKSQL